MSSPRKRKVDVVVDTALSRYPKRRRTSTAANDATRTLAGTPDGTGTLGRCGNFVRKRNWRIGNGAKGFIIQEVTRTFNVQQYDPVGGTWAPINGGVLDAYVTEPGSSVEATCTHYWELWKVRADGSVVNNPDSFSLCSLIPDAATIANTTKGSFTIAGEAYYYVSGVDPAVLGFASGAATAAGVLLSTLVDPTAALNANGIRAAAGPVVFPVTVTWDSTWNGVTPPAVGGDPFTPTAAWTAFT
jgi:hypothetical protein